MLKKLIVSFICMLLVFNLSVLLNASEEVENKDKVVKEEIAVKAEIEEKIVKEKTEEKVVKEEETTVKAEKEEKIEKTKEDTVAIVNGEKIPRSIFDRRLAVASKMNQDTSRSTQLYILDQIIKKVLLKQFAMEQKIVVSSKEIEGELEKIKAFLKSNPNAPKINLEEMLKSKGSSIEELKKEIRSTLSLSKYLSKDVDEKAKIEFFEANRNIFNGEKVRTSHILIDTRNANTKEELEKAKQKIEDVKKELDSGKDFAELAKKYSTCPSSEKGGDIGFFERKGPIVEPFAKVAFSMNTGEVSGPIKTQFGYHIIKVTEKQKGKDIKYDEAKQMVDFVYMEQKTADLFKGLRKKAKVEVFL